MIEITSRQWKQIPKDYKGTFEGTQGQVRLCGVAAWCRRERLEGLGARHDVAPCDDHLE
jgi:hypothetical protein